jgi:hypothetical protein
LRFTIRETAWDSIAGLVAAGVRVDTSPAHEAPLGRGLPRFLSIVETCRRHKIPLRDYLGSVLPGLANLPVNRVAELTPGAWLARRKPVTSPIPSPCSCSDG